MSGSVPANTAVVFAPFAAAGTRWGRAPARAPKMTSTIRWQVLARAATEAGNTALTMVPGGALTSAVSSTPWLFGISGSRRDFKA